MISAFTLVRVAAEKNLQVFERILEAPVVHEATLVYGEYDIVLKTITKDLQELNKFIYDVLRKIPHVSLTTTMIVAKAPKKKQYVRAI